MENKTFKINLRCVFCGCDKFDLPYEGYPTSRWRTNYLS